MTPVDEEDYITRVSDLQAGAVAQLNPKSGSGNDSPADRDSDTSELLRHLAGEVHDALGGEVIVARFALAQLEDSLLSSASVLPTDLASACTLHLATLRAKLDVLYRGVRDIENQLFPQVLQQFGLPRALEVLVQEAPGLGLRGHCEVDAAALAPVPPAHHLDIYRFVQEALTNAAKHAGGALVLVQVFKQGEQIRIEVHDDGPGLPNAPPDPNAPGKGLRNMKARANRLGGQLEIIRCGGKLEGASFHLSIAGTRAPGQLTC